MFKLLRCLSNQSRIFIQQKRTILSQAYYCEEVWNNRLNSSILKNVNLDHLYHDIDVRIQTKNEISAIDVDIFANALEDPSYTNELLDLIHKLRLSGEAKKMPISTQHATIRALLKYRKTEDLLNVLDDRINYGLFLDGYTANILLDTYWKEKDFLSGCRVASQLMLQEDYEHNVAKWYSLLHCFNYLLLKSNLWPKYEEPKEPEEEVKVRVNYLRNPYYDDHFDLRDGNQIVGKTLTFLTKNSDESIEKSFNILGWTLWHGKNKQLQNVVNDCLEKDIPVYEDIIDLTPNIITKKLKKIQGDVNSIIKKKLQNEYAQSSEKDIIEQCKLYQEWNLIREKSLEEEKYRILKNKRLAELDILQKSLKEKETKLWFFDNEEEIELKIEEYTEKNLLKKLINPSKKEDNSADYIPPDIVKAVNRKK